MTDWTNLRDTKEAGYPDDPEQLRALLPWQQAVRVVHLGGRFPYWTVVEDSAHFWLVFLSHDEAEINQHDGSALGLELMAMRKSEYERVCDSRITW